MENSVGYKYDEKNIKYLEKLLGSEKINSFLALEKEYSSGNAIDRKNHTIVEKCLKIMDSYGENRWWYGEDKNELAYQQIKTDVLLVEWTVFTAAFEKFVGHPVFTSQYGWEHDALVEEAETIYSKMKA